MADWKNYRRYNEHEPVEIGDTVTVEQDVSDPQAFGCCIVTGFRGLTEITLSRPHAMVVAPIPTNTQAYIACEVFHVDMDRFFERFYVHTTGPSGNKDNRRKAS